MGKKKKKGKYFNPEVDCKGLNKLWKKIHNVRVMTGSSQTSRISDVIQYYGYEVPYLEHDRVELVNKIIFNRKLKDMPEGQRVKVFHGKVKARVEKELSNREFYASQPWQKLRYQALRLSDRRCQCCGFRPGPNEKGRLHVDHIKPRSKYPELALKLINLQILCDQCNQGKSNIYEDDWRDQ